MVTAVVWPTNGHEENSWDYVLSNFKSDEVWVMGSYACTNNILRDAPRASTFEDLPKGEIVLLSPSTSRNFTPTIDLPEFLHPENAIYVFGPDNLHLTNEDVGKRQIDHIVRIPTDTKDEMFGYAAYVAVMWDRRYG